MTGTHIGQLLHEDGSVYIEKTYLAKTWWSRFKGLQFVPQLPTDTGLIIKPCGSIHTFWMRFPIHVIFLDETGVVLEYRESVSPWRIAASKHSDSKITLEVSAEKELPSIGERLTLANAPSEGDSISLFLDR